jgi:hypothetical protein
MSGVPAHRQPFAFTVHARGVDGQLKSGGGVVGTSEDDLRPGFKNRANLVALFRMLHAHVVEQDVAGNSPERGWWRGGARQERSRPLGLLGGSHGLWDRFSSIA